MSHIFEDRLHGESLSSVWAGTIARAPNDVFDYVEVLIAGFDDTHKFGPCRWTSPATDQTIAPASDPWHIVGAGGQPPFTDSWVNFGASYQDARFRKGSTGVVMIEGLVKDGSSSPFTLPVGYRPVADLQFASSSGNAFALLIIRSSGVVERGAGATTSFSINCMFYVGPDLSASVDAALPQVGDPCAIAFDEQNRPYVIGWWPV